MRKEIEITKEQLEDLYIKQNLSIKKVSALTKICKNRLVRILKFYKIHKSKGLVKLSQIESNLQTYATGIPQKKIQQTFQKNFGCHPMKLESIKQKIQQVFIKNYGVDSYFKTSSYKEKFKQTCIQRYGVEHFSQNPEIAQKMSKSLLKANSTGVPKNRRYETMKKNGTLVKSNSKEEEQVYQLLLTKFDKDDIVRQYRSELYPFKCDFYVKSLDLYIEYNGGQYHYKESFDKNNPEHLKRLNKLLSLPHSKGYQVDRMIKVWTQEDPLKRETAKKNNLNFKELFGIKKAINYINTQLVELKED